MITSLLTPKSNYLKTLESSLSADIDKKCKSIFEQIERSMINAIRNGKTVITCDFLEKDFLNQAQGIVMREYINTQYRSIGWNAAWSYDSDDNSWELTLK